MLTDLSPKDLAPANRTPAIKFVSASRSILHGLKAI
jgi:hypothetical protein